jgi:N-acetylmuramoyl-L-alanine amidase
MPAVRVELGYLTSVDDRSLLTEPLFRDTVAAAIVAAVQRLYESTEVAVEVEEPVGKVESAGESALVPV